MVKYLFLIIPVIVNFESTQAQIPNGGFELWDQVLNFEKPVDWSTNQDTFYTRIEKVTIAIEGNFSLKLLPTVTSSWQGCTSWAATHFDFDSVIPANSALTFYVKSVPKDPNQDNTVYLLIFGHTLNSDTIVGTYDWRTFTQIEDFTRIEIPLPGQNIDGMSIIIYGGAGSNPTDGPCLSPSVSWIDGMVIDSRTSVRPLPNQEKNNFEVYPNPSTGVVNITSTGERNIGYELYSLIGELIAKGKIENGQLTIREPGLYIVKLHTGLDDRNLYSKKLIVIK